MQKLEIYALSFYRFQNFLCWTKYFVLAQKSDCIQCLFKNVCAGTKTNFTECKSSFCLAQNVCDCSICKQIFGLAQKIWTSPKHFGTCKRTRHKITGLVHCNFKGWVSFYPSLSDNFQSDLPVFTDIFQAMKKNCPFYVKSSRF